MYYAVCLGFNINFVRSSVGGWCETQGEISALWWTSSALHLLLGFWTVCLFLDHVPVSSLAFHFLPLQHMPQVASLLLGPSVLPWIYELKQLSRFLPQQQVRVSQFSSQMLLQHSVSHIWLPSCLRSILGHWWDFESCWVGLNPGQEHDNELC